MRRAAWGLVLALLGCSHVDPTPNPAPVGTTIVVDGADPRFAHAPIEDGKYRNLAPFKLPTLLDLADWYANFLLDGGAKPPPGGYESMPVVRPDLDWMRNNRTDTTVTWVGHASVLLQVAGTNLIADPMFSNRAFFMDALGPTRKIRVPFTIAEAPPIDVVVVSHSHYDHLDAPSIDALARQASGSPLFVVPKGLDAWMRKRGVTRVVGLDWWDAQDLPAAANGEHVRITLVPVAHWSARSPFDRFETLWGGYVVERFSAAGEVTWRGFIAGDTGYAPLFHERIHARFPRFDFAALPIGAYEPNKYLKAQHFNPTEAVRVHRELDVRQSLGIHWGTFVLTVEPFDQPPKDLAIARAKAGLPDDTFVVFRHGEMRVLEQRGASRPRPESPAP